MKEGILTMEQGNGFYSKEKEMKYVEHLVKSMEFLAEDERTIFIGQSVKYSGNSIFNTLKTIPDHRKIETPVFEETQMGMSIGLSLDGYIPITCYPRFDFLLLAVNQMVNHLDKMKEMTRGEFDPRVIVRTSIGAKTPLDGGLQHTQDHTQAFRHLLDNVNVVLLENKEDIFPAYKKALLRDDNKSSLIIEFGEYYNQ
jgi:pyruvate/2-oxoglutarate/acetoin dehydrogenase E1 component